MALPLEIRSQLRAWKLNLTGVEDLLRWQLRRLGYPSAGLSLLFCGDKESAALNYRYRQLNSSTDILSFPANEGKVSKGQALYLGDLALNLPYAWRKRGRFANGFGQEFSFLLLHGICHLLGYHHDTNSQERSLDALTQKAFPAPRTLILRLKLKNK